VAARSQVRTLARAVFPNVGQLPRDQRDAVHALAAHLLSRFKQNEFEPFDDDGRTFLTTGYMRRTACLTPARRPRLRARLQVGAGERARVPEAAQSGLALERLAGTLRRA
jgi:hypothetical protein